MNSITSFLKKNKVQDMNINHIKLEVHDTYIQDEKMTTKIQATDEDDVINKAYLDEKLLKIKDHLSLLEKEYNEFKLHYNKQSVEEILFQRAEKNNYTNTLSQKFI